MAQSNRLPSLRGTAAILRPGVAAAYHAAVCPGMGPGTLDRVKVTWGPDTERGRRRLAELLVMGTVVYVPSELQYFGLASDGTKVMLGNPGPSTWDYLSKFPNPSDW